MDDNELRLRSAMSALTKREVFALTAYVAMLPDAKDVQLLKMESYNFSRTVERAVKKETMERKTELWFEKPAVQAFLEARIQKVEVDSKNATITLAESTNDSPEESLIKELEEIKQDLKSSITEDGHASRETMDMLIKTIREIHNIRHKSKNQLKEDGRVVQFMLPIQCVECPLYLEAKRKLK
jgi:post-segregation antitoxin (ccd killing protein)